MAVEASGRPLSRATLAGFAVGSVGTGLFSTVPTVLLLFYCTETLGITAAAASMILMVPKVWCLFWDPFVGRWSDRIESRWGRRAPFMMVGAFGTAIAFVALFNTPTGSSTSVIAAVAAAYLFATSSYTLFSVPYIAVPAEISALPHERERAIAWRMPCMMSGVLLGAAAAPHFVALGGGGRAGYASMSWTIAGAALLAMLTSAVTVRRFGDAPPAARQGASPLRHRPFQRLVLAYLMQMSAVAYVFAAMPYLTTQVLRAPTQTTGTLLGVLLFTSILAMPLWSWLSRRIGVQRALTFATLLFILGLSSLLLIGETTPITVSLAIFALLGGPIAALQLLPFMLLAHLINAFGVAHGSHQEGTFTGLFIAVEKVALAAGPMLVGLGLSALGHVGSGARDSGAVSQGIVILAVVIPAALGVASAAVGRASATSSIPALP